jgi:hypothetical protein
MTPRLVKGAKWTYGWVVVGPGGEVVIPPEAWREFGFQVGREAIFTPGSRRSGGFAVSTPELMSQFAEQLGGGAPRELGRGQFIESGQVVVPSGLGVEPGDRLLTVHGSRYGLGFVAKGPIYEQALQHPELEVWKKGANHKT